MASSLACRWMVLAVLLPGGAAAVASPADPSAAPPGFLHRVLANGLEATVLPDSSLPIVATRLWYHVGAANEAADHRGFAHLFEHFMFGGTASREKGAWEKHHHRFGGYENAFTSWDETTYESDIPPAGFDGILEMEADRMVNLRFDAENLENEKRIVTEELRARAENDPVSRVLQAGLKKLYRDHPYALTPLGTKEDIAAATLDRAREFYERYYRPRNAHLVVVGPVDGPATMREIERVFGPLPATGETPPDVPSLAGWDYPRRVHLEEDLPPVEVAGLIYPLPPPTSADDPAVSVLVELLTGGHVDHFEEDLVRRRRQALDAGSRAITVRRGGILLFYSAVLPYRTEKGQFKVMEEAMAGLSRLEWLTDETLAAVKRRILRRVENRRYFAGSYADALARNRWWRGDARLAFSEAERVAAVTRADVAAAYARYVARVTPVRMYVQPEKVPFLVWLFGWLYPVFAR